MWAGTVWCCTMLYTVQIHLTIRQQYTRDTRPTHNTVILLTTYSMHLCTQSPTTPNNTGFIYLSQSVTFI